MLSGTIVQQCTSTDTIASLLSQEPTSPVSKVAKELRKSLASNPDGKNHDFLNGNGKERSLDDVAKCGQFPSRPSDLFLKVSLEHTLPSEHNFLFCSFI